MTQQLPRIHPPGASETAPLWRSEIGKLDSLMATNVIGHQPPPPPPRPPAQRNLPFKALGLVAVALVAALVWLLIDSMTGDNRTTPAATTSTAPEGEFRFTKSEQVPVPLKVTGCAEHAYGPTKDFLTANPCEKLVRQLYTTTLDDGRTAYTSVSVVTLRNAQDAAKFKELTSADGTGNVNDLVREGVAKVPELKTLASGGFASKLQDREVVIVESDTVKHGPDEAEHNKLMKRISADAFRLAADLAG
ncbi:hypothetical protein [Umezawaea sp.]|uniref:hypothetical protein n=1 Tax=Umezawaea sp. TaxID=1955258 RepID=UPI002ECFE469